MTHFGEGLSVDLDLDQAAADATQQALAPLGPSGPDLVCVFVCTADPDDVGLVASQVADQVGPDAVVVGCSAGGVIGGGRGVEMTPAVSVWAACLPGVRLQGFHLDTARLGDGLAVFGLPPLAADDQVVLLLADPYTFPADGFVEQCNDELPGLPIVGGLATGLRGSGSTRLVLDGVVHERGAVGVLLGGPVGAGVLVSQGCRPIGPTMTVTRADGNVLLELAGTPALTKLEEIVTELTPEDQELVGGGLHIGITMDEYGEHHARGDFLIRGVVGVEAERGGVVIGDVVDIGQTVRFQVRDADAAEEDLRQTLERFRTAGPLDRVEGALLFSCNGRGAALFPSADHDVLAVRRGLGTSDVAGFFAAGEIGPIGGRNHLHGFTASVLAFGHPASGGGPEG